jgi:L-asparagine oxygenase
MKSINQTFTIDEATRKSWQQNAAAIAVSQGSDPYQYLLPEAEKIAKEFLPNEIVQALKQINQSNGVTSVLVKNMPIDLSLPPTPADGKRPILKINYASEAALLGTLAASGHEVLAYLEEKDGALVHEVVPIYGLENSNSNASRSKFGYHTDDASLKRSHRPEGIALICLRNCGAITWFAPLSDAMEAIDPYYVDILCSNRFRIRTPESFNLHGGKIIISEPRPIVSTNSQGQYEVAVALYSAQLSNNDDEEAQMALNALRNVLKPPVARPITLGPGDLFAFSNVLGFHSRDSFIGDRWLQRAYFRQSLEEIRRATNTDSSTRVFSTNQLVLE